MDLVQAFLDHRELSGFKGRDRDPAPRLGAADQRIVHPFQHRALAEGVHELLLPSLEAILEVPRAPHPRRKSSEGSPRAPNSQLQVLERGAVGGTTGCRWSRRVLGWVMANHLRTELVLDALNMALGQRRATGVIHHRATTWPLAFPCV